MTEDFVNECRCMNVTPHVAAKVVGSAIEGRTTRHAGYAVSKRIRKRGKTMVLATARRLDYPKRLPEIHRGILRIEAKIVRQLRIDEFGLQPKDAKHRLMQTA